MSKMSVVDENQKSEQWLRMQFVEFLECLCRIALYHFEDSTDYKDLPLNKRLELVLDSVLALKNLERRPVVIESQLDSDADISDAEY